MHCRNFFIFYNMIEFTYFNKEIFKISTFAIASKRKI